MIPVLLVATVVLAAGSNGQSGKSDMNHLYLYEKTPMEIGAWPIVEGGAWGKMNYDSDRFVFNGHGLDIGIEYVLISYDEPGASWPATVVELGTATADEYGNVHIKGEMSELICNNYPTPTSDEYSGTGAKIWLVLETNLNENHTLIEGWNPTEYLFESALVDVGCTPI